MGTIIAIGGGSLIEKATLPIDREIIRLTGEKRPRALFIPTASSDSADYWQNFASIYGRLLGCQAEVLCLLGAPPGFRALEKALLSAHLIYVGGGNTLKMMRRWRRLGVDRLLRKAYRQGTVLAGLSAGAICWFAYGHSDSMAYYHPDDWRYVRVKGLGLLPFLACPHYNSHTAGIRREADFHAMVGKFRDTGLGLDDRAALAFQDGQYRVLRAAEGAGAYLIQARDGRIEKQPLGSQPLRNWQPAQT